MKWVLYYTPRIAGASLLAAILLTAIFLMISLGGGVEVFPLAIMIGVPLYMVGQALFDRDPKMREGQITAALLFLALIALSGLVAWSLDPAFQAWRHH